MSLATDYMGLRLRTPLVASASLLTADLANIRQLEYMGAGAIVLPSLFEEQIKQEHRYPGAMPGAGAGSFAEVADQPWQASGHGIEPERYLELVERAVQAVDIPIIGSLNGAGREGWIDYAQRIELAGARALELNVYFIPTDLAMTGDEVEQRYFDILQAVKRSISIPVAVKLSPFFSAVGNMAMRLDGAGASSLVLFNRVYQPDIDLGRLLPVTDLELSVANEIRLPLLWIATLHGNVRASLAASTGVDGVDQVIKYLLVGADVVMTTSALIRHGVGHMRALVGGLEAWLEARRFGSVGEIRGLLSHRQIRNPSAQDRVNYVKILEGYEPQLPAYRVSDRLASTPRRP